MTKEELEKEAEEYASMYARQYLHNDGSGLTNSYCEVYNAYYQSAEPREKRIEELIALINAERERQEKCDDVHLRKIATLEKENTELKSENQKWKDEWQEHVQEATDEGYARTLQTIQLTKAKKIIRDLINLTEPTSTEEVQHWNETFRKAEQFISEVEK